MLIVATIWFLTVYDNKSNDNSCSYYYNILLLLLLLLLLLQLLLIVVQQWYIIVWICLNNTQPVNQGRNDSIFSHQPSGTFRRANCPSVPVPSRWASCAIGELHGMTVVWSSHHHGIPEVIRVISISPWYSLVKMKESPSPYPISLITELYTIPDIFSQNQFWKSGTLKPQASNYVPWSNYRE